MPDPRQYVRPGQRLQIAASQINALNEIMRVKTGFGAGGFSELQYAIVVPVRLTTAPAVDYPHIGVAIKISSCQTSKSQVNDKLLPFGISFISGSVAEPTDMTSTTALPAPEMFALTVEPIKSGQGGTTVVRCAVKGLAIARVRRFSTSDRYVALPTRRSTSETTELLRGTLETSAAGYGRFVIAIDDDFALISI